MSGPYGHPRVCERNEINARRPARDAGVAEHVAPRGDAQDELAPIRRRSAKERVSVEHQGQDDRLSLAEDAVLRGEALHAGGLRKGQCVSGRALGIALAMMRARSAGSGPCWLGIGSGMTVACAGYCPGDSTA